MYPNEARLRNMTYKSDLYANIQIKNIIKMNSIIKKLKSVFNI